MIKFLVFQPEKNSHFLSKMYEIECFGYVIKKQHKKYRRRKTSIAMAIQYKFLKIYTEYHINVF